MEEILHGLNDEQRAAVLHDDGPQLVVAGAGTGKTRVITRRIARLIAAGKARPGQILALTFTEKAAREMEERLHELIGWDSFQVPIMTFNAFGAELLARYASHIGRSIRGGLLNDTQKALLLQQHIGRIELEYYRAQNNWFEFLEDIVHYIGQLQNAAITPERYRAYCDELVANPGEVHPLAIAEQVDLARLYELYEMLKVETGTFDYHDQLALPLYILHQKPNLVRELQSEYHYILVDEYQDTNPVQDQLLRAFIGREGNLFAVGDDDQAIYGFRGADIQNILDFAEHFNLKQPVALTHNYRSGQQVLDAAYRLISHNNPKRLEIQLGVPKRLIAQHANAEVEYWPYMTSLDELDGVLESIVVRIANGEQPSAIAVLAATHAPLTTLAKLMRGRDVPFALSTYANIFEQPELIGLWNLLRWLNWQLDDGSISYALMGPVIGWSAVVCARIVARSRQELVSLEEAMRLDDDVAVQEFVQQLNEWRSWAQTLPISQLVFRIVFETPLLNRWREQAALSARMVRVFEDLQRWLEQMQDFETVVQGSTLSDYTGSFPNPPTLEVSEPVGDTNGVQLLTVHASKGLEFDSVYLIGCTQRSWSNSRGGGARTIPEGLRPVRELEPEHEFRRLMYVAVTRARTNLTVSAATQTAGGLKQAPSLLVSELFEEPTTSSQLTTTSDGSLSRVLTKLQRFYPLRSQDETTRLPFETLDGWLELSMTDLASYMYCPFEFYIEKVLQIKQPIGPQMSFGTTLHRVFEAYYHGRLTGNDRSSQELHDLLDELWSDQGYERREEADSDHSLGHRTLDSFLERENVTDRRILGSEVPIRFEVTDARLRLRGKIDALFTTEAGIEIRDFKTGRTKVDSEKLAKSAKDSLQLRTYALAYRELKGEAPAQVVLDYVVTGVSGGAALSSAILRNHGDKLVEIAGRIRSRDFAPNPSALHVCAAIRYYGTGEADELMQVELMNQRTSDEA